MDDEVKPACPFCGAARGQLDDAGFSWCGCGTFIRFDGDGLRSTECYANELAVHKQRLAAQSARLAAAESEVRRLRRVIDDAPSGWRSKWPETGITGDVELLESIKYDMRLADGGEWVEVKLVPIEALEANDG